MSIHLSQDLKWLFTLFALFARLSMHFISHLAYFCSPVSVFCILVCGGIHSHHQNHHLLLLVALDQPKDDRKKYLLSHQSDSIKYLFLALGEVCYNKLSMYISQVKGYLQVPPEVICKAWVHIQDLKKVIPKDAVQFTVGDGV